MVTTTARPRPASPTLVRVSRPSPSPPEVGPSYRELKRIVTEAGLLEKQPRYYTFKVVSTLVLFVAGLVASWLIGPSWWQLALVPYWAVAVLQVALLGHDAGHRQVFSTPRANDTLALSFSSLFLGFDLSWWLDEHNKHHAFPNHEELDPNIAVRFWAFTERQAAGKQGLNHFLTKYQALLLLPMNTLGAFYKVVESIRFIKNKPKPLRYPRAEPLIMAVHLGLVFGLPFAFLAPLQAVAILLLYYALEGLYLGAVISPNHKGMEMVSDENRPDFLHWQAVTARNITGGRHVDFIYGGLNYQIEHHLFPTMPRNRLRESSVIIGPYLRKHGVLYHETGFWEGFGEILSTMHAASAPLRRASRPKDPLVAK